MNLNKAQGGEDNCDKVWSFWKKLSLDTLTHPYHKLGIACGNEALGLATS